MIGIHPSWKVMLAYGLALLALVLFLAFLAGGGWNGGTRKTPIQERLEGRIEATVAAGTNVALAGLTGFEVVAYEGWDPIYGLQIEARYAGSDEPTEAFVIFFRRISLGDGGIGLGASRWSLVQIIPTTLIREGGSEVALVTQLRRLTWLQVDLMFLADSLIQAANLPPSATADGEPGASKPAGVYTHSQTFASFHAPASYFERFAGAVDFSVLSYARPVENLALLDIEVWFGHSEVAFREFRLRFGWEHDEERDIFGKGHWTLRDVQELK